uniref:COP9 signalosome complex subunit 3-like n=1 Tax=Styela clava TaxID=7725 RepID=UPI0019399FC1|nr:COP9 signalosome complex subunit 3-like [Styela clava]
MSGNLEEFVNTVRNLSSQGQLSQLCDHMNKSWNLLVKNISHLDTMLEALDIQEHTLGVLYILCVKVSTFQSSSNQEEFEQLLLQVDLFVSQCNKDQTRYSIGNFAQMCHTLTNELCQRNMAIRGIKLISRIIEQVQEHPSQLTSVHADLCQLCLTAKCLKPAAKYLDIEVTDISKENGFYECKHYLSYYYYGGMIYTALKNYKRALYFFEQAVVCPATAISHIMVEAYKKYILISIISEGRVLPFPKYTSHIVQRGIKPLCGAYTVLLNAYATYSPAKLNSVLESHGQVFIQDKNMGLVKQVIASLHKRNIQRLTKTFITLSLSDVSSRAHLSSPQEAETQLRNMIDDGEIYATINQKDGMVSFYDNPEKYNNPAMLEAIDKDIQYFMELDRKLQEMDCQIQVNPQYVKKAKSVTSHDDEMDGGLLSRASSSATSNSVKSG